MLGRISGYQVTVTTDKNPERVAAVQKLTWAHLCNALFLKETVWNVVSSEFLNTSQSIGKIESK